MQQSICIFGIKYTLIVVVNRQKNVSSYARVLRCKLHEHQVH